MSHNTHSKAVDNNLRQMGTLHSDWTASAIDDMDGEGGAIYATLPGYSGAPTMFPQTGGGEFATCELCGHMIRHCFQLQCDSKRWTLTVGSECVTHFMQESGDDLLRRKKVEIMAEEMAELPAVRAFLGRRGMHQTKNKVECVEHAYRNSPSEAKLHGFANSKLRARVVMLVEKYLTEGIVEACA
jgi:hypothetical protein